MKKLIIFSSVLFAVIISMVACHKDSMLDSFITGRTDAPLIEMAYNIETIIYHRNLTAQDNFDKIALTPDDEARSVNFKLFSDGNFALESSLLPRSYNFGLPNKPLQNNFPTINKFTLINQLFSGYDSLNNLIFQQTISMGTYHVLVDSILAQTKGSVSGEISNSLLCSQIGTTNLTLTNLINWAQAAGGTITNFGNGHVTIRISAYQAGIPNENTVAVLLINRNINRMLGSVLYDSNNNFISSLMYRYSDDSDHFLEGIQVVVPDTLPSGSIAELVNESTITDLSVNLNIP